MGDVVDEQGQQEDLEEKLKEYVDCLTDKSPKTRQGALKSLRLALASRLLLDFLLERRLTLADALEKCLKKGWSWGCMGDLNWADAGPCCIG